MSANRHYHNPSASLNKTPPFALAPHGAEGIFIPTSVKFAFVTVLLWGSMLTLCALSWVGAFTIGVRLIEWMR